MTVFAFFPKDTNYFGPGKQEAMVNLRVDDLDAVLEKLRAAGVDIDPKREDHDYGRFAWFQRPGGQPGGTLAAPRDSATDCARHKSLPVPGEAYCSFPRVLI